MRTATGYPLLLISSYIITYMDEFIDSLLVSDRYCDVIIPRIKERYILEDLGQLDLRVSTLEEELEEEELGYGDLGTSIKNKPGIVLYCHLPLSVKPEDDMIVEEEKTFVSGQATDPILEAEERGWSKKKIKGLYKTDEYRVERKETRAVATGANNDEGLSTEETNRIRKSLGLGPLK
jgi:hypothetical protein